MLTNIKNNIITKFKQFNLFLSTTSKIQETQAIQELLVDTAILIEKRKFNLQKFEHSLGKLILNENIRKIIISMFDKLSKHNDFTEMSEISESIKTIEIELLHFFKVNDTIQYVNNLKESLLNFVEFNKCCYRMIDYMGTDPNGIESIIKMNVFLTDCFSLQVLALKTLGKVMQLVVHDNFNINKCFEYKESIDSFSIIYAVYLVCMILRNANIKFIQKQLLPSLLANGIFDGKHIISAINLINKNNEQ